MNETNNIMSNASAAMNEWRAATSDYKLLAAAIRAVYRYRMHVYAETSVGAFPATLNPNLQMDDDAVARRKAADDLLEELKPHMKLEPESDEEARFRAELERYMRYGATMHDAEMALSFILAGRDWEITKRTFERKLNEMDI